VRALAGAKPFIHDGILLHIIFILIVVKVPYNVHKISLNNYASEIDMNIISMHLCIAPNKWL